MSPLVSWLKDQAAFNRSVTILPYYIKNISIKFRILAAIGLGLGNTAAVRAAIRIAPQHRLIFGQGAAVGHG